MPDASMPNPQLLLALNRKSCKRSHIQIGTNPSHSVVSKSGSSNKIHFTPRTSNCQSTSRTRSLGTHIATDIRPMSCSTPEMTNISNNEWSFLYIIPRFATCNRAVPHIIPSELLGDVFGILIRHGMSPRLPFSPQHTAPSHISSSNNTAKTRNPRVPERVTVFGIV
jgi:hypothetical protein